MWGLEVKDTIVKNPVSIILKVMNANSRMTIQTVYLFMRGAGEKSYLNAIHRMILLDLCRSRCHNGKAEEDYEKSPKNVFELFHDAKLIYIFYFQCF